ncbi:protein kinase family protein [Saccharomonospora marina XMU15]|uniref:non-specific serine/threonine protein kinase n=2 Tax=Saccharomonospora TaxID=1851 RepID=H5X8B9_9PSEU|nr:protein kinase family protein [Saccharomonospora marina XMU15]
MSNPPSKPPAFPDEARLVAGRYRLRSVLGSGSMGTVWSAYDEFLQRPVAVKEVRMPPGVPATRISELRERTLREARAIAVLSHPNVITLHDVVRENGDPYVVMELLPARSLAGLLHEAGRLTVPQAAAVADAVAAALEAAHAAGITHRDVKPGNVLVAGDGRIKLTDFGIARNVSEATMTHTGMMLGSPAFIAPEVASGGAVTYTADLWGLGATLFAATEGHPPYDADGDPFETVTRVVHGDVPRPSAGPLAPLIRGLMAKRPAERMSLSEVRRRLYPLLRKPHHPLFPAELFRQGERSRAAGEASVTRVIPRMPSAKPSEPPATTRKSKPEGTGGEAGALAADPGPLPFAASGSGPATGSARAADPADPVGLSPSAIATALGERIDARRAALVAVAMLLFLAAAAAGFALTRVVAGQALEPPQPVAPRTAAAPTTQSVELLTREGDATNLRGAKGGLFSVAVPANWLRFTSQRPVGDLPTSTLVRFVSPDGTQVLGVEHFANYFPDLTARDYVRALTGYWPEGDFTLVRSDALADGREGVLLGYRTAERGSGQRASNRTTHAEVFRSYSSLWVVSVTVPLERERFGRSQLFDRIVPTFRMTS